MVRIGFIAIGRPTFDVEYAHEHAEAAHRQLSRVADVSGTPELVMDEMTAAAVAQRLQTGDPDGVVVFQATFADSTLVQAVADRTGAPLVLWATREERSGGRLRLNSFCGINLAGYALARRAVDYRWVYGSPFDTDLADQVVAAATGPAISAPNAQPIPDPEPRTPSLKVGVIGQRPDGFEPCDFDAEVLLDRFGVVVDPVGLDDWFGGSDLASADEVERLVVQLDSQLSGVGDVDQGSLAKSLRLFTGLDHIGSARGWDGVATRCWPECFTEYGGAACAANSMMTSKGRPGCCEADVYGVVTSLALSQTASEPAFVADLVDIDVESNTAVFWHCGSAPVEMAGSEPQATIHSNRELPLLNEFPLRPGQVTIARVSQSQDRPRLVLGAAEMLDEPLPFSGTSGVARMARPANELIDTILGNGLEHHYGIVYGDHRDAMARYADDHGLEVVEI